MRNPANAADSEGAFVPGTRIATLSATGVMGEIAVEALQPGDTVLTLLGPAERATPVRAIRRVRADPPGLVVRIRAGALAPSMPPADLVLPA
ncbi:MAG: Hint domain-containing protein, partial [Alphaproteobacteria bacterium]|nr:Hint domain-containing protein [Alphaproteobacteria bacterium]